MNDAYLCILAFLFGLFLYTLCECAIKVKRRIQANRDRRRYLLAIRPNERDLAEQQNWFAMQALKLYTRPKKRDAA